MAEEPLKSALNEIEPKLNPEFKPLVASLLEGQPAEDAWEALLQEILDEA
jgi:hypothetical protein